MIRVAGTAKTIEANGAAVLNNNVGQADDASYSVATDGAGYAHAEISISGAFSVAPTEHSTFDLWARPLTVDGISGHDSEAPENGTAFKGHWYLGAVFLNNVTSTQYLLLRSLDIPPNFSVYFLNLSGQTLSAGWTMKVTPIAYKAAP